MTECPEKKQAVLDKWLRWEKRMENEIILYTDENGKTNVSVRFADEKIKIKKVK